MRCNVILIDKILNFIVLHNLFLYGKICRNRYIKISKNAVKISEKNLLKIIKENKDTAYGKKYNFKDINSIEAFQNRIPLSSYIDYKEYIDRTAQSGEQGLITKDKINGFSMSSGTTGITKMIPTTKKSLNFFVETGAIYFMWELRTSCKKKKMLLLIQFLQILN